MSSNQALMPLVLHAHVGGPNPFKIAIALEALSVPYTVKVWEFGDAPNGVKGEKFLEINENGRVPALEDPNTNTVSWESAAIMTHVLHTYDREHAYHPSHHPSEDVPGVAVTANPQGLIDFDKWIAFLISTLGPMMGQANWFRHYNAIKNDDALERYTAQSYRCFDVLEGQLAKSGGESVLATGYSAVDWHFYPWVAGYGFTGLNLDKHPMIKTWLEVIKGKGEVGRAYEKIGKGEKV
ncbi:putative glutathione S-transferase 2 [Amylocarpus encephaloides]|uniref:Glutathione S-transferase 2 n=1 Tax=Amylocarpus encephaloides TaxID=45428 RepID=A0A9P7YT61_9HELO|nr:putative glutathione S-transferase 2 [Amylocarpus encephaloides]